MKNKKGFIKVCRCEALAEAIQKILGLPRRNFVSPRNDKKRGFTLAEVLITLGIIGIVAAMTIPTLMANNQKTQYVTALKKAYAEVNQALIKMATDHGCVGDLRCIGTFSSSYTPAQANTLMGDELVKYIKTINNCKLNAGQKCWADKTSRYYDGTNGFDNMDSNTSHYKFTTADGMSFYSINYQNNCGNNSTGATGHMKQTCGIIYIDVNGAKKPNSIGRDVFMFYITNGKGPSLYPQGGADDNCDDNSGECSWKDPIKGCYPTNKYGYYCTGRVMEEGWQMNY